MPDSLEAVAIALVTVAPGFIATSVWSRARLWRRPESDLRMVLQSLVFTAVIQVLLAPLTLAVIYPVRDELLEHPRRLSAWAFITLLVAPTVIGWVAARVANMAIPARDVLAPFAATPIWRRATRWLIGLTNPPSLWDAVAEAGTFDGRFVVIEFDDGRRVAGAFGAGSAVMNHPEPHSIFLSREWILDDDGDLLAEVPYSRGLLVPTLEGVRWIRVQASPAETEE